MNEYRVSNLETAVLTTQHAASSYGQPVLVIDGIAYGPGDTVNTLFGPTTAANLVADTTEVYSGRVKDFPDYPEPFGSLDLAQRFAR